MNLDLNSNPKPTILIIDDSPDNLNLLSGILGQAGYKINLAPSGKLALKFIESNLPDLILLDIMMPQTDGYQVCEQLKASEQTQDIPIIFISALQEISDKIKAFSLGGVDYITKPFNEQEVLVRIETQLRMRQLTQELNARNKQLGQELTERRKVEEALRQQNELLQTIFDRIPVMVVLYDEHHLVQFVNREFESVLGWSQEELKGVNLLAECYPDTQDWKQLREHWQLATGKWQDFKLTTRGGTEIDNAWMFMTLSDGKRLGIGQDIRDRLQAEEASRLEERNRMAREIHDTLAQSFTGIIIHLGAAERAVTLAPQQVPEHLRTVRELARSGLTEARRSVQALRPQLLEQGDLYSALYKLTQQMSGNPDIETTLEAVGSPYSLPSEVENHFLRIAQEALTNAFKYAQASLIEIKLLYHPGEFCLRVKDNGQGFDLQHLALKSGFGLMGMQERADRLGAKLAIDSQLGQGTEIIVSLPVESPHP
ncbi:hybrid sensor histidine kinase/response regulator [Laspinema olomoucense]|uniref:hybrid sensor histidine kinase/response regulator n=1 Tax=Laspinema olomoucense TaxID=3231600 RepID=UPI0021BB3E03|nr:response regulator [Laspinema sp. D3d]MCT7975932.1 response regulator [Laspinema sp. D3d]